MCCTALIVAPAPTLPRPTPSRPAPPAGSVKLHKAVAFDTTLRLRKPVLAEDCPDCPRGQGADYNLVATVSHHGRGSAGEEACAAAGSAVSIPQAAGQVVCCSCLVDGRGDAGGVVLVLCVCWVLWCCQAEVITEPFRLP